MNKLKTFAALLLCVLALSSPAGVPQWIKDALPPGYVQVKGQVFYYDDGFVKETKYYASAPTTFLIYWGTKDDPWVYPYSGYDLYVRDQNRLPDGQWSFNFPIYVFVPAADK